MTTGIIRMCDDSPCVDEAVAHVRVLDAKGAELLTLRPCRKHLVKMQEAAAERDPSWPAVTLEVTEFRKEAGA